MAYWLTKAKSLWTTQDRGKLQQVAFSTYLLINTKYMYGCTDMQKIYTYFEWNDILIRPISWWSSKAVSIDCSKQNLTRLDIYSSVDWIFLPWTPTHVWSAFQVSVEKKNLHRRLGQDSGFRIQTHDFRLTSHNHRHSESTEYTVLYTRRCRTKLNQLFITRRKIFINL